MNNPTIPEKSKSKDPCITISELLFPWHHSVECFFIICKICQRSQEPTVPNLSLVDVESVDLPNIHLWFESNSLRDFLGKLHFLN